MRHVQAEKGGGQGGRRVESAVKCWVLKGGRREGLREAVRRQVRPEECRVKARLRLSLRRGGLAAKGVKRRYAKWGG